MLARAIERSGRLARDEAIAGLVLAYSAACVAGALAAREGAALQWAAGLKGSAAARLA